MGLDHISYLLNPIDKWFEFYQNAKNNGIEPHWTINHGWITGMYYKDPDGHLVEIFSSTGETKLNLKPILHLILSKSLWEQIWI